LTPGPRRAKIAGVHLTPEGRAVYRQVPADLMKLVLATAALGAAFLFIAIWAAEDIAQALSRRRALRKARQERRRRAAARLSSGSGCTACHPRTSAWST
jgi:hypothetical protein